jgi:cytochrome c peroxidase
MATLKLLGCINLAVLVSTAYVTCAVAAEGRESEPPAFNLEPFHDATGAVATFNSNGRTNPKGAFFQPLGINGRTCATCHAVDQAMSISPPQIKERFAQTHGKDPLFAAVDGANCEDGKASDPAAHSLLLSHGLIRIPMPVPVTAQFTVSVIHDPYGCALVPDPKTGQLVVSQYRRPLPTTNLRYLSTMMFDGRESPATSPLNNVATFATNLNADLTHQAQSAISTHFQANTQPTAEQLADIVSFEMGLTTAQVYDRAAGRLDRFGALGGPLNLFNVPYYPGVNDVLGADPKGIAFDKNSMTLFSAWANASYRDEDNGDRDAEEGPNGRGRGSEFEREAARRDIAAGETLFNTAPMTISAVRGLNDNAALGNPASFQGNCTTCHDAPNVGDHSLPLPLDIGTGHTPLPGFESDPNIHNAIAQLDEPNLPVFLISGCPNPFGAGQAASFYTTDLGKGLVTGLCSDLNRVKGPILRGLAARAPYFHNGAAASLLQAVNFYNQRFAMNLTEVQKRQLVAFLNSL